LTASAVGIRLKIKRAEQQLDDLKLAIEKAVTANAIQVESMEDQPEGKRVTASVIPVEPPPDAGLYVGDAVHNLRTALDHLVCQLAIAARNPSACERETQFPIYIDDTPNNRKAMDRRIQSISGPAQTAIKALQPYQRRPHDPAADLLWMLSELDNIDKHRLLLVVNPKLADIQLELRVGDDEAKVYTVSKNPQWVSLKHSAMRFRLTVAGPPGAEVQVKALAMTGVVFAGTGLRCDGAEIAPLVREMITDVTKIVDDLERLF
jgi:hypothetical protein